MMTYLQSRAICTVTFKMAPNRGTSLIRTGALKLAKISAIYLLFTCVNVFALEGIMNSKDQDILRKTVDSLVHRKEDIPNGNGKAEAAKSMPDSLPLTAVFSNSENTFMQMMDANRLSAVEPYQGDMLLDKVDEEQINQTREDERARRVLNPSDYAKRMLRNGKRNMVRRAEKLWVTKVVPYEIDASRVPATKQIQEAFTELEGLSCLKFRKRISSDRNWIRIYRGNGCYSDIGRSFMANNPTSLSLGNMCLSKALILHELMHALGFFHEQSRMDRDSFVNIYSENIRPGMESNFEKIESYEADVHDTDYDFDSIMQYGTTAFTRNGADTMRDKFDPNKPLGGRKLSNLDIIELNKAYQCHSKSKVWSDWSHWGPCEKDWSSKCTHHRQRYCFSEDEKKCGNADEFGVESEKENCEESECQKKLDGHWGAWGNWGACSKSCDEGTRERGRACDNPKPENGGHPCKGNATGTDVCRLERCFKEPDDTNFENGWGMWTQGTSDDFDWELRSGGTPTLRTGPDHDHTTGDGAYAYIEGSPPRLPNEVARLISKRFMPGFIEECFTFYYLMNGKHIGYLDLSSKTQSGKLVSLFRKNGHQGPDWINAAVNIPEIEEPFFLVFEAQRGIGELSDIAIDDLYFDQHKCTPHEQGCQDHNPSCGDWGAIGECEMNKAWMKKHCCKTCYEYGSCHDTNAKCEFWARRKQCQENKGWMWKNCCRACRYCQNQHPDCESWSSTGECERNPKWMSENCPASCKSCSLQLTG